MDCNKAEKLLVEYMYQELTPEKTLELEKHLHVCDNCSKTLENWRVIHRGYQRSDDLPQPAPYLKQRLLAAAREEIVRKPSIGERLFLLLKPALVLPILVLGLTAALILPLVSTSKKEMAQAPKPVKQQPPAAAMKTKEDTGGRLDKAEEEKLKDLGYLGEASEKKPSQPASPPEDVYSESAASRNRDPDYKLKKAAPAMKNDAPATESVPVDELDDSPGSKRQEYEQQQNEAPKEGMVAQPPMAAEPQAQAPAPAGKAMKTEAAADMRANFVRAQSSFQSNDLAGGKDVAEVAIQQDTEGKLASEFHSAGRAYQTQGEPQQAIVQYNLVLNNYPTYENAPDVLLRLGESYEQIGQYDKAIETYKQLQRYAKMRKVAVERIGTLNKKQQSQEQLRSLGYVSDKN